MCIKKTYTVTLPKTAMNVLITLLVCTAQLDSTYIDGPLYCDDGGGGEEENGGQAPGGGVGT